jgi:pilus assembly protein CpaF
VVLSEVSNQGSLLTIRNHNFKNIQIESFFKKEKGVEIIKNLVLQKKNILVVGGTGVGKTTFISGLLSFMSSEERIILLEDNPEIVSNHSGLLSLHTRESLFMESENLETNITLRNLLKESLRMRPDRIILGECRGEEVFDLLQMLNTGHCGSVATLHANGVEESLVRLETLALLAVNEVSQSCLFRMINASIQVVVFIERYGSERSVSSISEIILCSNSSNGYKWKNIYE